MFKEIAALLVSDKKTMMRYLLEELYLELGKFEGTLDTVYLDKCQEILSRIKNEKEKMNGETGPKTKDSLS